LVKLFAPNIPSDGHMNQWYQRFGCWNSCM